MNTTKITIVAIMQSRYIIQPHLERNDLYMRNAMQKVHNTIALLLALTLCFLAVSCKDVTYPVPITPETTVPQTEPPIELTPEEEELERLIQNVDTLFPLRYRRVDIKEYCAEKGYNISIQHFRDNGTSPDYHWQETLYPVYDRTQPYDHWFSVCAGVFVNSSDLDLTITARTSHDIIRFHNDKPKEETWLKDDFSIIAQKPGVCIVAITIEIESEEVCDVIYVPVIVGYDNAWPDIIIE